MYSPARRPLWICAAIVLLLVPSYGWAGSAVYGAISASSGLGWDGPTYGVGVLTEQGDRWRLYAEADYRVGNKLCCGDVQSGAVLVSGRFGTTWFVELGGRAWRADYQSGARKSGEHVVAGIGWRNVPQTGAFVVRFQPSGGDDEISIASLRLTWWPGRLMVAMKAEYVMFDQGSGGLDGWRVTPLVGLRW